VGPGALVQQRLVPLDDLLQFPVARLEFRLEDRDLGLERRDSFPARGGGPPRPGVG